MTYTRSDRVATITYPGGGRARYGRDAQGRLNRVWWRPAGTTTETNVVTAASYLPFGPLRSLTFGNGRTLAKAYDQNYWIDTVTGTPAGLALDFGTDEVGNIVGLTVGAAANDRVYDYDDLNRLTSVVNGTAANVEAFTYDPTGNRLSKRIGPAAAVTYAYPTGSHRLESVGGVARSYDAGGNTLSGALPNNWRFRFDARNRLSDALTIDRGEYCAGLNCTSYFFASYGYNGRGERVWKGAIDPAAPKTSRIDPGVLFTYDESGRLLSELSPSGKGGSVDYVWMDDMPVAVIDNGARPKPGQA